MQAGDIIFVRGNSLLSSIIKHFDNGEFTHVAIALDDKHVIEADCFKRVSIAHLKYDDYEIVSLPVDAFFIAEKAFSYIGKRYDYIQIFSYMSRKFFKTGVINDPSALICSELVADILEMPVLINSTPNELYKAIKKVNESVHTGVPFCLPKTDREQGGWE